MTLTPTKNVTKANITTKVNETHSEPLEIRIANISRLALITITFNWKLEI